MNKILTENTCGPCNKNCQQGRTCPKRSSKYLPNDFILACLASVAVWIIAFSAVFVILA